MCNRGTLNRARHDVLLLQTSENVWLITSQYFSHCFLFQSKWAFTCHPKRWPVKLSVHLTGGLAALHNTDELSPQQEIIILFSELSTVVVVICSILSGDGNFHRQLDRNRHMFEAIWMEFLWSSPLLLVSPCVQLSSAALPMIPNNHEGVAREDNQMAFYNLLALDCTHS